jgi:RNA polymerase sigma factor (sigma-70 family)
MRTWARGRVPASLRSIVDTDDVLHDALVRGLRRLPMLHFADESWLLAYLHRAVVNRLTDLHRRAGRIEIDPWIGDEQQSTDPSPLESVLAGDRTRLSRVALRELDRSSRQALVMRFIDGASYDAIARAIGKPTPEAARVGIRRTLAKVAARMQEVSRANP